MMDTAKLWAFLTRDPLSWAGHSLGMIACYYVLGRDPRGAFFAYLFYEVGGQWVPKALRKERQNWKDNLLDLVIPGFALALWVVVVG